MLVSKCVCFNYITRLLLSQKKTKSLKKWGNWNEMKRNNKKKKRNCLYFPMILKSMKLKGLLLIDGPNPFHSNSFQWSFTSCLLLLMVVGWKDAKGLGIPFCQTKSRILSRSSSWMGNAWVKAKTKVITRRIFMSDWVLDHTLRCFLSTFIL